MKKLLTMLLFVAGATSCDKLDEIVDDVVKDNTEMTYEGTLAVSKMTAPIYTDDDVDFVLEKDGDKVSVLMVEVKFMEQMPVTLDIKISEIPTADGKFAIDTVVPTVGVAEMPEYTITNVDGEFDAETLEMSFVCMGFDVNFKGAIEE